MNKSKYVLIVVGEDNEDATQNIDKTVVLCKREDIDSTLADMGPQWEEKRKRFSSGVYKSPVILTTVDLLDEQAKKLDHDGGMSEGRTFTG